MQTVLNTLVSGDAADAGSVGEAGSSDGFTHFRGLSFPLQNKQNSCHHRASKYSLNTVYLMSSHKKGAEFELMK